MQCMYMYTYFVLLYHSVNIVLVNYLMYDGKFDFWKCFLLYYLYTVLTVTFFLIVILNVNSKN